MKTKWTWTWMPALLALLAASSCEEKPRVEPAPKAAAGAAEPAKEPPPPARDVRDQYALAREIEALEDLDPIEAAPLYQKTRQEWLGRRYTWSVYLVPALCPSERRCYVVPFDRRGEDRGLVHGWLPRLDLDVETFADLRARCGAAPRCRVTFAGTLSRLVLSTERPTSLAFADVELEG